MRFSVIPITLAVAALTGAATAQANFQLLGTACTTLEGTPGMHNNGLPMRGQSFEVFYTGPNDFGANIYSRQPHLVVGFGTFVPGVTIPQWFMDQPPNCVARARHDIVLPMPPHPGGRSVYEDRVRFDIPNDPTLQGASFFVQWLTVYTQCGAIPGCWTGWIAASETGVATIG